MSGCSRRGIVAASVAASVLAPGVLAGCLPPASAGNPFTADGTVDMVVCLKPGADAQSLIDGLVLSRPAPPNALEGREVAPGVAAIRADPAHHAIDIKFRADRGPGDAANLRSALASRPEVDRVQEHVVRRTSCNTR